MMASSSILRVRHFIRLFLALALAASNVVVVQVVAITTGVTPGTIILKRGADANSLTSSLDVSIFGADYIAQEGITSDIMMCQFDGGIVNFLHPMSLKPSDKFFKTGQLQLRSIEMMVDEINTSPRCGILVGGKNYGIQLTTFGDDSSSDKVGAIVQNGMIPAANNSDTSASFWLGPYSSGLTSAMSPFSNSTNTILVAGGAAATSAFADYSTVFGTFPPTKKYLAQAIEALAKAGAKTASSIWEDASFTRGVCAALPELAEEHGLTVQSEIEVQASPTGEDLDPIAMNMSRPEEDPDVVVTCVYDAGCSEWISSLRRANWSPRGQVFTVCIGMDSFVGNVGTDAMYMMGISPWDPSLAMEDNVVGWSATEFAEHFLSNTARAPTYHSASGAASVGVLVQAIERADSFDTDTITSILATEEFTTLYGKVSFDTNGQSKAPSLFLQYNSNLTVDTVYPIESRSGDLLYPMPTWQNRDCLLQSTCQTGSVSTSIGVCQTDGSCTCNDSNAISSGKGVDAKCVMIPVEEKTYINSSLRLFGIILFSIQCLLSFSCCAWTFYYRKRRVVKASQPIFLGLVCLGGLVMSCSIIPLGIQANYRELQREETGELTGEPDPSVMRVDIACMALPWLFSIGFAIIFSALFAKIWRIRKVWKAAQTFRNVKVNVKDVMFIMVAVILIQVVILLCWQLIDPMHWQREIIMQDANGFPTQSIGYCSSDGSTLPYLIPLVAVDGLMLMYAIYLCFVTRKVKEDFQEGRWIFAVVLSILQILVLSIPILVIVENNNDAFYFVRASVIFLIGFSVMGLIFFPKMYRLHTQAKQEGSRMALRVSTIGIPNLQPHASMPSSYDGRQSSTERKFSLASSQHDDSMVDNVEESKNGVEETTGLDKDATDKDINEGILEEGQSPSIDETSFHSAHEIEDNFSNL